MSAQPARRRRRYHALDDNSLKRLWDMEYDEDAECVLEERAIVRDLATNPDSKIAEPQVRLGPRVWLQFKKDKLDGRVSMWLEMDEAITLEKLKEHWPEIRQWQEFLREWQGPEKFSEDRFVSYLHQNHGAGFSYADLVGLVVDRVLYHLRWIRRNKLKKFENALTRIDSWSEEETQHWASECGAGLDFFRLAGGRDEELICAWLKDALRHLVSNGKRPIKADIPLTRDNVIQTLRSFRKRFNLKNGVGKIG